MLITIPGTNHIYDIPSWICYTLGISAGYYVIVSAYMNFHVKRHRIEKSLKDKVILITGGTSGIGKECVKELAIHGATIHVLARDLNKGEKMIDEIGKSTGNQNVHVHFVNLSDFTTVRMLAKKFLATDTKIHVLINNAALINMEKKTTVDGLEENLQANYLSHFLLTNLLLERVISSSPSRIINVSSVAYNWVRDFDPKDMNWTKRPYGFMKAYAWTKLETIIWTRELARRLLGKGVTVNSLHPGGVRTSILRDMPIWWLPITLIARPFGINAYLGAQTLLYLVTSRDVDHVSGHYFYNCHPQALNVKALDDQTAAELWWESDQLTSRWK